MTGLEPAASCSQSKHSSQTELHPVIYVVCLTGLEPAV